MASAGIVVEFDDDKGFGAVRTADPDGTEFFFHCTAIADGSRTIDVGTNVTFDVVPGHLGRYEAANLTPVRSR